MERNGKTVKAEAGSNYDCPMCGTEKTLPKGKVKEYSFQICPGCELVWCPEITPAYLSGLYAEGFHGPQDGAPKKGWCRDINFLSSAF